jgi:hypothetical protein
VGRSALYYRARHTSEEVLHFHLARELGVEAFDDLQGCLTFSMRHFSQAREGE